MTPADLYSKMFMKLKKKKRFHFNEHYKRTQPWQQHFQTELLVNYLIHKKDGRKEEEEEMKVGVSLMIMYVVFFLLIYAFNLYLFANIFSCDSLIFLFFSILTQINR